MVLRDESSKRTQFQLSKNILYQSHMEGTVRGGVQGKAGLLFGRAVSSGLL